MAGFNKIILIGNLTRDPQLSYLPNQTPVCEIGLAVNRKFRKQDGQQGEEVCFIDCSAFGKQAETLNQYMTKGRQILVEGRLQLDQWETQDGQKRSKHRVNIQNFQFLDGGGQGRGGGSSQGQGGYTQQAAAPQSAPQAAPQSAPQSAPGGNYPPPADMPPQGEDIPF